MRKEGLNMSSEVASVLTVSVKYIQAHTSTVLPDSNIF